VQSGDSACRKVADDAITTIKDECDALQKTVDTAAKAPTDTPFFTCPWADWVNGP
jgi:hypothetical protein